MKHPHSADNDGKHLPRLIAWEVTRSCLLACKHCRAAAQYGPYTDELSTEECYALLDNIASFSKPVIILTGGEPMLRPDIYDIASYARKLGLPVVMAPCGVLLNDVTANRIIKSGIHAISISLDGATAESHDDFRGMIGAFESAINAIEAAKRAGLAFQINTTVSRHNIAELPELLELAVRLGAKVFNPFLLVPTGRGKALVDQEITPEEYEKTLRWLASQQSRSDIQIRVTCAPHYHRITREEGCPPPSRQSKGCMGGQSFAFISHRGIVQICGFLDVECGDLRKENLDFKKIWDTSEVFARVRQIDAYHGRCGYCEYRKVCGGCRARAFAMKGDYLAEEPFCVYEPKAKPRPQNELDAVDAKIMDSIQADLPVDERPFAALAEKLDLPHDDVLARVRHLQDSGVIRRIGPIFDTKRIGYASTLVAARVPEDRMEEVVEHVNSLQGVTHNYRRDHDYNLWFTLTARTRDDIEATLADLRERTGIKDIYSLPALSVYKLNVNFSVGDSLKIKSSTSQPPEPASLTEKDKHLVRLLQESLPVVERPFDAIAEELESTPGEVVERIREWLATGVIRRFGVVVRHHKLGYVSNGMCVFSVPEDRLDTAGRRLAECGIVSHCYSRPTAPGWRYNLYAMMHSTSEEHVRRQADALARELVIPEHDVLFSTEEFKKVSMRFFEE